MKTVFSNHYEVAHEFARRSQNCGRAGNIFFDGDTIYSYGHHFPVARFVDNTVVFTTRDYSVSTAKHINIIGSALSQYRMVYVPDIHGSVSDNLSEVARTVSESLKKASTSRIYKNSYLNVARIAYENLKKYAELIKDASCNKDLKELDKLTNAPNLEEIRKEEQARRKEENRRKKERQARIDAENAEKLEKWLSGESDRVPFSISKTYLRINGNNVETTRGAHVSAKSAKILWRMIKAEKSIHGVNIDGYTVISWNGELKIGCHNIPRSEVLRIGAILDTL